MFEVAHALRQGLHLAQTFVHLLQPVGHLFEALAQTGLQGALQLFIHSSAHLIEFGCVADLQLLQLGVQGGADFGQATGVGLAHVLQLARECVAHAAAQLDELLRQGVDLCVLGARGLGRLAQQSVLEAAEVLLTLQTRRAGVVGDLATHLGFQTVQARLDGAVGLAPRPPPPRDQDRQLQEQDQRTDPVQVHAHAGFKPRAARLRTTAWRSAGSRHQRRARHSPAQRG